MDAVDLGVCLLLAAATRLIAIAATVVARSRPGLGRLAAFGGSVTASLVTGGVGVLALDGRPAVHGRLARHDASGLTLDYSVDALSGFFLVVLAILGIAVAVYSIGYFAHSSARRTAFVGVAFNVLLGAVEMVFVADGVIGFLFAWELMTLATAALVATEHEHAQARRAAFLYLVMSHVGTGCLIAGFFILASRRARSRSPTCCGPRTAAASWRSARLSCCSSLGFGVKAGSDPAARLAAGGAPGRAQQRSRRCMSGVLIKTGIYGIFRVCCFDFWACRRLVGRHSSWPSAPSPRVLGVLYALMEHDLKRLLAYHSIENIGIILHRAGRGDDVPADRASPVLAALALIAALVPHPEPRHLQGRCSSWARAPSLHATRTRNMEEMGGLTKRMPWTALFFLHRRGGDLRPAAAQRLRQRVAHLTRRCCSGFRTTSDSLVRLMFPLAGAMLALTGALAAACFVKAFGITFLALPRSGRGRRRASRRPDAGAAGAPRAGLCRARAGPGLVARSRCAATRGGLRRRSAGRRSWCAGWLAIAPGAGAFDHLAPPLAAAGARCSRSPWRALSLAAGCAGAPRADLGLRWRADGRQRVHGHGVLEAADDDLQRDLPADAGGGRRSGSALPARGEVPGGDRADVRAVLYGPLDAGRAGRWPSA